MKRFTRIAAALVVLAVFCVPVAAADHDTDSPARTAILDACTPAWDPADSRVVTWDGRTLHAELWAVGDLYYRTWGDADLDTGQHLRRWRWEYECLHPAPEVVDEVQEADGRSGNKRGNSAGGVAQDSDNPPNPDATPEATPDGTPEVSPNAVYWTSHSWSEGCTAFQKYDATPVPDDGNQVGDRWVESLFHPTGDRKLNPCDRDEELPVREPEVTVEVEVKDEAVVEVVVKDEVIVEVVAVEIKDEPIKDEAVEVRDEVVVEVEVNDEVVVAIEAKDEVVVVEVVAEECEHELPYRVFHAGYVLWKADLVEAQALKVSEQWAKEARALYLEPYSFYTEDGVKLACKHAAKGIITPGPAPEAA